MFTVFEKSLMSGAYMPVISMLLYAHAAAGPEYEYPACLNGLYFSQRKRKVPHATYGAMMALHPLIGGEYSAEAWTACRFFSSSEFRASAAGINVAHHEIAHGRFIRWE